MNLRLWIAAWSTASMLLAGSVVAQPLPRSALILDQYAGSLPWVGIRNTTFRMMLNAGRSPPVSIFEEFLDLNRFAGPSYKESLKRHLAEKYRDKPLGLIVAFGPLAFEYAVDLRAALWPTAPLVFGEISEGAISRSSLPPATTGTTINITLGELIVAARTIAPDLKRIAIVGDSLDKLPAYRHFKEEIPTVARELEFIDLTGLAMAELRKRVAALPDHTVIAYTTINLDGAGVSYVPAEALSLVAEAANRPIVISTETFLSRGAVGGFVVTPVAIGQAAARLAARIFDGEDVSTIPASLDRVNKPIFDWRQLRRWGISESALPAGSEVRFREPTAWEQYRWQITAIAAALLIQTGLIVGLFYEHKRRREAEAASRSGMRKLTEMNRVATAGELAASIAHEVNQPLTGIVATASAARRWLAAERPDLSKIRAALDKIENAGHRASDIVANVREMFKKDKAEKASVDMNTIILAVLDIMRNELERHQILVRTELLERLPKVAGNPIQLQQVILNLVRNAADAMESMPGGARVLTVTSANQASGDIMVSVADAGTGIDPDDIGRIFHSFFTTKPEGMGMGLAICRSIVEAHGGRIWASAGAARGSVFNVQLPAA
jgi:signal transduction histidine kinase